MFMLGRYLNGLIAQMESFKQKERQVYDEQHEKKNQNQIKKRGF